MSSRNGNRKPATRAKPCLAALPFHPLFPIVLAPEATVPLCESQSNRKSKPVRGRVASSGMHSVEQHFPNRHGDSLLCKNGHVLLIKNGHVQQVNILPILEHRVT